MMSFASLSVLKGILISSADCDRGTRQGHITVTNEGFDYAPSYNWRQQVELWQDGNRTVNGPGVFLFASIESAN